MAKPREVAPEPSPVEPEAPPPEHHLDEALGRPMNEAPRDGRWVEVTQGGGHWVRARFYQTRIRLAGSVAWAKVECWSTSEPSKYATRVDKPVAWREAAQHVW